jgi:hypothetical protein
MTTIVSTLQLPSGWMTAFTSEAEAVTAAAERGATCYFLATNKTYYVPYLEKESENAPDFPLDPGFLPEPTISGLEPSPYFCPNCGENIHKGNKYYYCLACGIPVNPADCDGKPVKPD